MSTLTLDYTAMMNDIGFYLGFGSTYTSYASADQTRCDNILQRGLRQFYFPPPVNMDGRAYVHQWSFLHTTTTLAISASDNQYDLPSDFGSFDGPLYYPNSNYHPPIEMIPESAMLHMISTSDSTGDPIYGCVRAKSSTGTSNQGFELVLFPVPSTARTLTYSYTVNAQKLTTGAPYPLGSLMHHETIRESCLAIAESDEDDTKGLHWDKFMSRLEASVRADLQMLMPEFMGYNSGHEPGMDAW